ncbi:MAG: hypothetical protein F4Y28_08755 [Acidimicrobiia bacterium]|nr:hypothetical protein [Acidimicrobiia bacterium]MYG57462.1 hypothetical protein [Acidimicrobiia bacterium]MYJ31339.1 hypothetical protein [Acidimicrobiia bacterium]
MEIAYEPGLICESCLYYDELGDGSTGYCRRHAPNPEQAVTTLTKWPLVGVQDWCAEGRWTLP